MDQKGQHLTLEQMFFFTIGIIILVSVFLSYATIQKKVESQATADQIEEISNSILSGIAKVAKELEYNDQYEIVVEIPQKLGEQNYIVSLANNQLEVRTFDGTNSLNSSLESMNQSYQIVGSTISSISSIRISGNATSRIILVSRYQR